MADNLPTRNTLIQAITKNYGGLLKSLGPLEYHGRWKDTQGELFELWSAPVCLSLNPDATRLWIGKGARSYTFVPDGPHSRPGGLRTASEAAAIVGGDLWKESPSIRIDDSITPSA